MRETLSCATADLRAVTTGLEPGTLTGTHALSLLRTVSELERLVVAARVVLARRVADSGVAAQMGKRTDESLVASATGNGVGDATRTLELGKNLENLSATREAFLTGKLSPAAAEAVAAAASRDPAAEARLLKAAAEKDLKDLRSFCRTVRPPGETDEERHRRERKARFVRFHNSDCGRRMVAQGPTVEMTRLEKLLEAGAERFFREACAEGRRDSSSAYLADALLALAEERSPAGAATGATADPRPFDLADTGSSRAPDPEARAETGPEPDHGAVPPRPRRSAPPPKALVIVRVDAAALRRGYALDCEVAEIPGAGPVPISAIREILPEALIRSIVTDGVDIKTVVHHRRTVNAHLRTALLWRDGGCVECGSTRLLQTDHHVEFTDGGPTSLDNLRLMCKPDHRRKTAEEAKARLRRSRSETPRAGPTR